MSNDDDKDKKRKNPWANSNQSSSGKGRNNPWGNGQNRGQNGNNSGNRGGNGPSDLDDLIKNAQDGLRDVLPGNMNGGVAIILFILAMILLWLASGFHIINPGEHGVIQRFGAWSRTQTTEGLGYHFPAPIEILTKVNVNQQRGMSIGYTESVPYKRGATVTKQVVHEESLMLTSDRNIVGTLNPPKIIYSKSRIRTIPLKKLQRALFVKLSGKQICSRLLQQVVL